MANEAEQLKIRTVIDRDPIGSAILRAMAVMLDRPADRGNGLARVAEIVRCYDRGDFDHREFLRKLGSIS